MTKVGKTIYLFSDEGKIECNEDALLIKTPNNSNKFPFGSIGSIVIFGDISLTTPVIYRCSENNIVIHCVSTYGSYRGSFHGTSVGNVVLRKSSLI